MNLLKETINVLKENGKSEKDVLWCGSVDYGSFDFETFKKLANKAYDSGFGSRQVAEGLLVVGDNWWLERHEYDGSEWWEYKSLPKKPKDKIVTKIFVDGYENSLSELNK